MEQWIGFILIGFFAQLIDGSLGMGYKTSAAAFLLSIGVPPVLASASVHTAGIFTSGVSGLSHAQFGNVDRGLMWRLALPGIAGGIAGAILLTSVPTEIIKPLVAVYLLLMGLRITLRALGRLRGPGLKARITPLAAAGGFFDAVGGGGWGPIVTGTLVAQSDEPRYVIGSVNLAEFFVSIAQAVAFFSLLGALNLPIVGGLMIGGVVAAPIAAYICKHLPLQRLMLLVGLLVIFLSGRTLLIALAG